MDRVISYILLYSILLCSLSSCYSYRTNYRSPEKKVFKTLERSTVFVVNDSLFPAQYDILQSSNLYHFTQDGKCPIKLELSGMERNSNFVCLTGFVMFLGQIPMKFPTNYTLSWREIRRNEEISYNYVLNFDTRYWFWDIFSLKKNLKNAIAKELRYEQVKMKSEELIGF